MHSGVFGTLESEKESEIRSQHTVRAVRKAEVAYGPSCMDREAPKVLRAAYVALQDPKRVDQRQSRVTRISAVSSPIRTIEHVLKCHGPCESIDLLTVFTRHRINHSQKFKD